MAFPTCDYKRERGRAHALPVRFIIPLERTDNSQRVAGARLCPDCHGIRGVSTFRYVLCRALSDVAQFKYGPHAGVAEGYGVNGAHAPPVDQSLLALQITVGMLSSYGQAYSSTYRAVSRARAHSNDMI